MATTHLISMHKIKNQSVAYTVHERIDYAINPAKTLGGELAMSWTKGKHQFIVATHIDHAHIHTHIIYNSTRIDAKHK